MTRCKAQNAQGEPCRAQARPDSEYCFWHDPALAEQRDAARRKGGAHRRRSKADNGASFAELLGERKFRDMEDMIALLEAAIRDALRLENSIARARALGYLAGCWAKVYETGELERQLRELEARHD